jgi:hypothetical protein
MAADRRRLQWLGALLVVAVVAVIVALSGNDANTPATPRRATPADRASQQPAQNASPVALDLQALTTPREAPSDLRRDPFSFQRQPEPPEAPPPKRIPGVPDDQVGAPPRVPAGPPPPPPITLKFIGIVQKADGTKIAVLSDGKRPIYGQEGEEIEGRYKILKIGTESLDIAYLDGRGQQTIRLSGQ